MDDNMMSRRHLLTGALVTGALGGLAVTGTGGAVAAPVSAADPLRTALRDALTGRITAGGAVPDAETVDRVSRSVADALAPAPAEPVTGPLAEVDVLIAWAFGDRPAPEDADPLRTTNAPGPINEELAKVVAELVAVSPVPVVAQWEIAYFLQKWNIPDVTSVELPRVLDGIVVPIISTDDITTAARDAYPDARVAGVIAHHDHADLCIDSAGIVGDFARAYVPAEATLPTDYDPESTQAWTRDRQTWMTFSSVLGVAWHAAVAAGQNIPGFRGLGTRGYLPGDASR